MLKEMLAKLVQRMRILRILQVSKFDEAGPKSVWAMHKPIRRRESSYLQPRSVARGIDCRHYMLLLSL